MNEKREQLNILAERGTPVSKIEREAGELRFAELARFSDETDREYVHVERETLEVPYTHFETEHFTEVANSSAEVELLTTGKRAEYLLYGTGWSLAALAGFALNSVVLVFDGGLLNIFFTTAGYLAYKQFKAAITGKPNVCLEFKCTNKVITSKLGEFFAYLKAVWKKMFTKKEDCLDCVAFA
jgi:hypothetical protein